MSTQSFILPPYFQSGMVLQQHAPLTFQGVGPANTPIEMEISRRSPLRVGEQRRTGRQGVIHRDNCVTDSNGAFSLFIPSLEASYNLYTISIQTIVEQPQLFDEEPYVRRPGAPSPKVIAIQLDDVLVGEVWVTGGQGNMELPLAVADEGKYKSLLDDKPYVRLFTQNAFGLDPDDGVFHFEPQKECSGGRWLTARDYIELRTVSSISAHFAVNLEQALRVPVGIVQTALAEAPVQSWIDYQVIQKNPSFVESLKKRDLWVTEETWLPKSRHSIHQPAAFFNHKIAPFQGMRIRGFLIAQGENEVGDELFYEQAFKLQLESWRSVFNEVPGEQIQLLYTGLAPAVYAGHSPSALPMFNLTLARMRRNLPIPAGFIALQDLSPQWRTNQEPWDNHLYPTNKREVAERVTTVALGLTYNRKSPPTSPEVRQVKRVHNKLMLSFRHLSQPLIIRPGESVPGGFAICGEDQVYRKAEARLLYGMQVMVWHPDIELPRQVTYAYAEMCVDANLRTGENLAIAPFATAKQPGTPAASSTWLSCDQLTLWAAPFPEDPNGEGGPDSDKMVSESDRPSKMANNVERAERIKPEFLPVWKAIPETDIRLKIDTFNKREGVGALEVSYAGDRADLVVLSPELDYYSLRPRLNLANYDSLSVVVFNPDGRKKDIRVEGVSDWLTLEACLRWQEFEFPLTGLREKDIVDIRIHILDKVRSGKVLFDQFELKRKLNQPFADALPISAKAKSNRQLERQAERESLTRPTVLTVEEELKETVAQDDPPEGIRSVELDLATAEIETKSVEAQIRQVSLAPNPPTDGTKVEGERTHDES
ncbi:MAG: hypothetical protein ACOX2M_04525 [Fastidiosipilaceae bacterium]|jgi:sialate O-acetylesterase